MKEDCDLFRDFFEKSTIIYDIYGLKLILCCFIEANEQTSSTVIVTTSGGLLHR
jgi:hypothetical protein